VDSFAIKEEEKSILSYVPSPAILRAVKFLRQPFFQNVLERTWNAGTIHWGTVNHYKFLAWSYCGRAFFF